MAGTKSSTRIILQMFLHNLSPACQKPLSNLAPRWGASTSLITGSNSWAMQEKQTSLCTSHSWDRDIYWMDGCHIQLPPLPADWPQTKEVGPSNWLLISQNETCQKEAASGLERSTGWVQAWVQFPAPHNVLSTTGSKLQALSWKYSHMWPPFLKKNNGMYKDKEKPGRCQSIYPLPTLGHVKTRLQSVKRAMPQWEFQPPCTWFQSAVKWCFLGQRDHGLLPQPSQTHGLNIYRNTPMGLASAHISDYLDLWCQKGVQHIL